MKTTGLSVAFLFLSSIVLSCNGQSKDKTRQSEKHSTAKSKLVGGGCDGCELMYVGMPKNINSIDTSAGWREKGQKLLVKGKVYKIDGRTPAPNVIIYYWQTDNNGLYSSKEVMDKGAKKTWAYPWVDKIGRKRKLFNLHNQTCPLSE